MRKLAAVLLIALVPVFVVLGAIFMLSASYKAIAAETTSGDLSAVAGDLTSPEDLAKERAAANKRLKKTGDDRGGGQMVLAVVFFVAALVSLVGGVLCLVGRRKKLAIGCAAIAGVIAIVSLVAEGFILLAASAGVLALLALLTAVISKDWRQAPSSEDKIAPTTA